MDSQIAKLWNEPRSAAAIGRAVGLSTSAVRGRLQRMRDRGVELRGYRMPTQQALNSGRFK